MLAHIVYANPSQKSFTHQVFQSFLDGLEAGGHTHTVSDLYAMGFQPVLTPAEYTRETGHDGKAAVPPDVAAEHAKLNAADAWVFVYPLWWMDCPAILKGWFDRVWTVGFAYDGATVRPARKALALITAGHSVEHLRQVGEYQALETVMLADRMFDRAEAKHIEVFGGTAGLRGEELAAARAAHLATARKLGQTL